jgi:hypothetical protein
MSLHLPKGVAVVVEAAAVAVVVEAAGVAVDMAVAVGVVVAGTEGSAGSMLPTGALVMGGVAMQ